MQDKEQQFEVKLPARITGLVFWGLVFICLLATVFFLRDAEPDLVAENQEEMLIISYEIEEIIEQYPDAPVLEKAADKIIDSVNARMNESGFHAIRLYEGEQSLSVGVVDQDDDLYEFTLHYYPHDSDELHAIDVEVYCAGAKVTIANLRKNYLLSIGISVFIFGLLLQRILQRMLSSPFQKMVATAECFSQGKENVRFNEDRNDEFGYLGKFINDAIDTILKHKDDLMLALERASTSEIALSIEKEQAEVTLSSITDTVVTVDVNERIVYINPAGEKLLGRNSADCYGKPFKSVFNIIDESSGPTLDDPVHECFTSQEIINLSEHSSLIVHDNALLSIEASIAPMRSTGGDLMGAVIVIQDVSHTRLLTKQLSYHASHDLLTGLYNRRKFEEYLSEVLADVGDDDRQHTLLYLDLDNFKIVNDSCGHVAGDELLKQLPALFHEVLRSGDVIARLGGDEFGIILENCNLSKAEKIADKIRQTIKDYRFIWDDKTFDIGVSIGVIGIDADNSDISQILSAADMACYAAKDSGRNRVHVYESSDKAMAERYGQMHWTAKISKALEENRFILYQQPIVGVIDNNRDHLEILLRMIDEDKNIILPGAFMPAAERYGLMPAIDRWVIRETFKYMAERDHSGPVNGSDRVYAINLSGDSINDNSLLDFILEEKTKNNISLKNVCFEITETVAISNLDKATLFINELKTFGCKFALDDFGSGLSSFAYLKTLPVNFLKIDGAFVKDICNDVIDRAMVESIQQVGKVMQLETIAEHVEDEATLLLLREIGVDFAQGYHLGRPAEDSPD